MFEMGGEDSVVQSTMRRTGPTSTYKSEGRCGGTKNVCGAVGSYGRKLIVTVDCDGDCTLGLRGD